MKILVTGAAGYIGSHTCVELLNSGYEIVTVDDLSNSHLETINKIKKICKKDFPFERIDLNDYTKTNGLFKKYNIDVVMHFAGFKAVSESVNYPLKYYRNNINITLSLLSAMKKHNVNNIVFSSSATVYGKNAKILYKEDSPLASFTSSPYGNTKLMIETILKDISNSSLNFNAVILRYFNPVGAHKSAEIGEDPLGIPNNLMPYIAKVASGELEIINIFGNDYNTPDGTCLRDFIHVTDLAKGHVAALQKIKENCKIFVCNLGTGKPHSVLEIVKAFSKACGKNLPYVFKKRRKGDLSAFWADASFAEKSLNWKATKNIDEMCESAWNFQKNKLNVISRELLKGSSF